MPWKPYREPLSATLWRTIGIAVVGGGVLAWAFGRLREWPVLSALVLWFSFGGHWVELWFLNWLRPRISSSRGSQVAARLVVWFVGGVVLGFGVVFSMRLTSLTVRGWPPPWWVGGVVFVAVELVAHLALFLRGRPSFYGGEG